MEQLPVAALAGRGRRARRSRPTASCSGRRCCRSSLPTSRAAPRLRVGGRVRGADVLASPDGAGRRARRRWPSLVERAFKGPKGLTVAMRNGLLVYFGDATRPHAKWLSLARRARRPELRRRVLRRRAPALAPRRRLPRGRHAAGRERCRKRRLQPTRAQPRIDRRLAGRRRCPAAPRPAATSERKPPSSGTDAGTRRPALTNRPARNLAPAASSAPSSAGATEAPASATTPGGDEH